MRGSEGEVRSEECEGEVRSGECEGESEVRGRGEEMAHEHFWVVVKQPGLLYLPPLAVLSEVMRHQPRS